jgi:hypothetical protein
MMGRQQILDLLTRVMFEGRYPYVETQSGFYRHDLTPAHLTDTDLEWFNTVIDEHPTWETDTDQGELVRSELYELMVGVLDREHIDLSYQWRDRGP